jgi:NAD(P)-dependent dehydrogenase (short-subunit alcohol dehydrogenase family)
MERPLEGKVALVAGGTRGAGRGISVELGAAGATVQISPQTPRPIEGIGLAAGTSVGR